MPIGRDAGGRFVAVSELMDAIRAVLAVFEAGTVNSAQVGAIRRVRAILGDVSGSGCSHESTFYEDGDRLVCQVCRKELTPVSA